MFDDLKNYPTDLLEALKEVLDDGEMDHEERFAVLWLVKRVAEKTETSVDDTIMDTIAQWKFDINEGDSVTLTW